MGVLLMRVMLCCSEHFFTVHAACCASAWLGTSSESTLSQVIHTLSNASTMSNPRTTFMHHEYLRYLGKAMALTATMHHFEITLSDVDRSVYESLDLRVARHPSECTRYMLTRLVAYCLSYEEGIAFSKGGLSSTDEPPILVHDLTGVLLAWIDVGAPSAERLHKASKAARRVSVFTHTDLRDLRREVAQRPIHRMEEIAVWQLEPAFLDELEGHVDRNTKLELVRNDGRLYVTVDGRVIEGSIVTRPLEPG